MTALLVLALIVAIVGAGALLLAPKPLKRGALAVLLVGIAGVVGFGIAASHYIVNPGTAYVTKSFTGQITGYEANPGWHWISPFDSTIEFDIKNQQIVFARTATGADGQPTTDHGDEITVAANDGVSSNVDVAVNYSIDASKVIDIYKQYQSADNYRARYIENTLRSAVRETANDFSTLQLNTQRAQFEQKISTAIAAKWAKDDYLTIDQVSLQDVRIPDSVKDSYAAAQNAQISVTTEQNKLKAAQVAAQQQVVEAKATAEANRELEKSLTPAILKQHALDTMAKLAASGNLVVTDSSGSTLLNVGKK